MNDSQPNKKKFKKVSPLVIPWNIQRWKPTWNPNWLSSLLWYPPNIHPNYWPRVGGLKIVYISTFGYGTWWIHGIGLLFVGQGNHAYL
jgi:hypothetical protein